MHRRRLLALSLAPALAAPAAARAQDFAARPIRLVVPYPPGGSNGLVASLLQPHLQERLGRAVQVEYRGGQAGSTGATLVGQAAADGHTWLLANETLATNESTQSLPWRAMERFTFASLLGTSAFVLTAHPRSGIATWRDMLLAARARPGALGYATNGAGTGAHITAVALQRRFGFSIDHGPYRGGGPAFTDALAGHVPLFVSNFAVVLPAIRAGQFIALGQGEAGESRFLPGVPSFAELGFEGFESRTWWVVAAPSGTPAALVARMHDALGHAIADATVQARFAEHGIEPLITGPSGAATHVEADISRWARLVRDYAITAES